LFVTTFFKFAVWSFLLYGLYCGLLFIIQRQIIFPRGMIPQPPAVDLESLGVQSHPLQTSFGRVETWFMPPAEGTRAGRSPAVIFGHGNGELIDFWPEALKRFTEFGVALMLVEYPGYGRSEGSPSRSSIAETFVKAYDRLVSLEGIDSSRIVLFGRSLGGGAVCDLAKERPSAALILMSTFKSVRSFAARYLAPAFLIRDPFDNWTVVRRYAGPVLVIHGRSDEIIPLEHGQALHSAAQDGKMIIYSAGHNDCPPDWDVFWRDIETFLKEANVLPNG
jgi:pimeloyl-ACP methyl ester carboxylesterase